MNFINNIPQLIYCEQNEHLCRSIYENEVIEAIWSLEPDKDLGLDDFTIHFYRACWSIIKHDLLWILNWTTCKDKIGASTNSTFLALIPKNINLTSFNIFWPISLYNASYKILTKILSNRLNPLLPNLISKNQGGLMPNRKFLAYHISSRGYSFQLLLEQSWDGDQDGYGKCIW